MEIGAISEEEYLEHIAQVEKEKVEKAERERRERYAQEIRELERIAAKLGMTVVMSRHGNWVFFEATGDGWHVRPHYFYAKN